MRRTPCWLLLLTLASCAPDREQQAAPASPAQPAAARPAGAAGVPFDIRPGATRFVDIVHTRWKLGWALQLPETIASRDFYFMDHRPVQVEWRQVEEGAWQYVWRGVPWPRPGRPPRDLEPAEGLAGASLRLLAEIETLPNGLRLGLTLTNESASTFYAVRSEGGCLQARNRRFEGGKEVRRIHVMVNGKMTSLAEFDRTSPVRCVYNTAFRARRESPPPGDYWGTSSAIIDAPAIIGAVSRGGRNRFIALGYEAAWSAMQNADFHHCMHSQPYFGDFGPGETVSRRGYILFGGKKERVVARLSELLAERGVRLPEAG